MSNHVTGSCITRFETHPSFQINREPIWHIDHLEALFNLFVKFNLPQVFALTCLQVKCEHKRSFQTTDIDRCAFLQFHFNSHRFISSFRWMSTNKTTVEFSAPTPTPGKLSEELKVHSGSISSSSWTAAPGRLKNKAKSFISQTKNNSSSLFYTTIKPFILVGHHHPVLLYFHVVMS